MTQPRTTCWRRLYSAFQRNELHVNTRVVAKYALLAFLLLALSGCRTPPDLTGFPANTPKYYTEDKVFFVQHLKTDFHTAMLVPLQHIYQVDPQADRSDDIIKHNDPISVVLQGVRISEDLPGLKRDIAVVLDIQTSGEKGLVTLVAFYQRDVPAGQMLNFNNLLVYADPMWDSANQPYFRVRVLDVKAERNRRTGTFLSKVSNLSSQIGGVIPHPVIPIVTSAIDAANLILSNQGNVVLMDFQIQFYGIPQTQAAGGATLGPLLAGQWVVLGRQRDKDSGFWHRKLMLDRETDRIVERSSDKSGSDLNATNIPVPYVSVALIKADADVPKLVMDRSQSLISLLSTPSGKSDVDSLDTAAANLLSAVDGFTVERRLQKYQSWQDVDDIISKLKDYVNTDDASKRKINPNEMRRLVYVINRLTDPPANLLDPKQCVEWWDKGGSAGKLVNDPKAPMGVVLKWTPPASPK